MSISSLRSLDLNGTKRDVWEINGLRSSVTSPYQILMVLDRYLVEQLKRGEIVGLGVELFKLQCQIALPHLFVQSTLHCKMKLTRRVMTLHRMMIVLVLRGLDPKPTSRSKKKKSSPSDVIAEAMAIVAESMRSYMNTQSQAFTTLKKKCMDLVSDLRLNG
ncbi:hypothetical protein AMTR_s00105p00094840 [Amborella trichopoda]|uniref:Uncharacterized protein n=1 Tax=Amborella trichopoda TaxID=13333 RepID=W1NXR1_AMBTC|nr:hypothetical protein AMTR_s00105p00094840 [Amborella trichopoda]